MSRRLAKPSSIETKIKNTINDTQRRMKQETGIYLPHPRRIFVHSDAGVTVTLHGEGLGHGPIADYEGPHGFWQANLSIRGAGKPRRIQS